LQFEVVFKSPSKRDVDVVMVMDVHHISVLIMMIVLKTCLVLLMSLKLLFKIN